jgi:hypothetical protein
MTMTTGLPFTTLNNGIEVPALGLGVSNFRRQEMPRDE